MIYRLTCRLDVCNEEEYFDTPEQIEDGEWTEVSPLGAADGQKGGETVYEHRAYCPGHSL